MEDLPLWAQLGILALLLLLSAFFSGAETAMMALSRLRLRHLVRQGSRAARITQALIARTDRLLGVVLLGNSLLNTAVTAVVASLTIHQFGAHHWALPVATVAVAFFILVFAEVTPKIIGAAYPERIALPSGYVLRPLLKLATPAVWFVNLFARGLLKIMGLRTEPGEDAQRLSPEELRTIVLEGGSWIPGKHRSMLLNLFDLERLTVDDVMAPRSRIESLDLAQPPEAMQESLRTSYHNKLPVHEGDITRVAGILHLRKLLPMLGGRPFDADALRPLLVAPYFIPSGTPLIQQLQMFQENRQRLGLVVDEYGEVIGLVTVEDIVEEIVGEFTTQAPVAGATVLRWDAHGTAVVDGTATLRLLNRRLGLDLPLDGPKTLNGLLLERLEQIPDGPCCVKVGDCVIEVIQIQDQAVRSARLHRGTQRARSAG